MREWPANAWRVGVVVLLGVSACADDDAADPAAAGSTTAASNAVTGSESPSSTAAPLLGDDDTSSSTTAAPTTAASTNAPNTTERGTATTGDADGDRPTIDELLERDEPLLIAHQGGEHDAPSSTLYAYGESVRAGADMLELDVQLSADGEIVVIHDDVVDRRTNATGAVSELSAAELAELDAGYWFVPECGSCHDRPDGDYPYRGVRTGEQSPPDGYTADDFGIPTLRQVAKRFPHLPLDIEIKGGAEGLNTVEPLEAELAELGLTESAVIATFDHDVAEAFRQHAPEIDVTPGEDGLLAWLGGEEPLDGYRIVQIPHRFEGIGDVLIPEILDRLRDGGFDIWVWIGESDEQTAGLYEDILSRDVDAILADRPAQLRRVIDDR